MKIARFLLTTLAAVVVVGAIASAAPHVSRHGDLASSSDPTEAPEPTETPEPTEAPDPPETPDPADTQDPTGGTGTAPDFSACVGLTGLENAICRHEALLAVNPDNKGLANSLAHLQANLLKHQTQGQSGVPHGQSGLPHGHSGEPHGQSGEPHGNSGQ